MSDAADERMSVYEQTALREIHVWKDPELTWFEQAMRMINDPIDQAGEWILKQPGVGPAVRGAVEGIVSVANDAAHWSVRPSAIYADYRSGGHDGVNGPADVFAVDLEVADRAVGWLDAKYKGLALGEGAAAGVLGIAGIAIDVPALVTMNLRAIGEYATYYGFDINNQHERLFALNILGLASSPTDAAKVVAMAQLVRIAQEAAKKAAWRELERHVFVQIIQHISQALGVRLTKVKLAQAVPVAGAVVGGGFNAYFTSRVCDAAYYLYRERFLAEKYGPDVIEVTVKPADDFDPGGAVLEVIPQEIQDALNNV